METAFAGAPAPTRGTSTLKSASSEVVDEVTLDDELLGAGGGAVATAAATAAAAAAAAATAAASKEVVKTDRYGFIIDSGPGVPGIRRGAGSGGGDGGGAAGKKETPAERKARIRLEVQRLGKWSKMLKEWKTWSSTRREKLQSRVRKGVPEALRGEVWSRLAGVQLGTSTRKRIPSDYDPKMVVEARHARKRLKDRKAAREKRLKEAKEAADENEAEQKEAQEEGGEEGEQDEEDEDEPTPKFAGDNEGIRFESREAKDAANKL